MSRPILVRAYVVGFGDCILLTLPDGNQTRNILIDFGRAPNDASSLQRFPEIARDIARRTGKHLDLLIMTHEHLDHMEGFYREREVFDQFQVDRVWMSLPSDPDYYRNHPKAKLQKRLRASLASFAAQARRRGLVLHPGFQSLLENNLSNVDRIDYLRKLGKKPVAYLARGEGAAATTLFKNIKIRVLAPEPDVSVYYSAKARENALMTALAETMGAGRVKGNDGTGTRWDFPSVPRAEQDDLGGLSPSDFERLRRTIREDGVAAARFIDRAQNNTSLCLLIEAAGKRLLLPGDAELESWEMIAKKCKADLKPVDFLKVSHHGSHNGTPLDLLDSLLPVSRKSKAQLLVSTKKNVYGTQNPVPDTSLLEELKRRCRKLVTTDGLTGTSVELTI